MARRSIETMLMLPGTHDYRLIRAAKPGSCVDQCLQHSLQVEGRAADDFEHL